MFDYILKKIEAAPISEEPFRYVYIADLLHEEHLASLLQAPEIRIPEASSDEQLFELLEAADYAVVPFPGCTVNAREYLAWRKGRRRIGHHPTSAAAGMALRLESARTDVVVAIKRFIESEAFNHTIARKFDLDPAGVGTDAGIQKYLDGYEIAPHPDTRKKALTFMVNLNPHAGAEQLEHHTHYLRFTPERRYVQSFWEGNPDVERCFVPWDWCETVHKQTANNSIVIFRPADDTLHGVRARYDHLAGQRTQLYGNLWYPEQRYKRVFEYPALDILAGQEGAISTTGGVLSKLRNAIDARLGGPGHWVDFRRSRHYEDQ